MLFRQIRRPARFLLLVLSLALLVVACQTSVKQPPTASEPTSAKGNCRIVEHEMGETEVCGQPQKVAALSPHILDSILALGVQPAAYAESIDLGIKTFDNPIEQIPYLGRWITTQPIALGDRKSPSLERLASIKPDVIIGEHFNNKDEYSLLTQIAPTLLFSDTNADGQQFWQNDIQGIAQALGREAKAEELLAHYPEKMATAREQLASVVAAYPKVLVIGSSDNLTSAIYQYGPEGSTASYLLKKIGFEVVSPQNSSSLPGHDVQISMEVLPQVKTNLIFVMAWTDDSLKDPQEKVKQQWSKNPLLKQMSAFKEDHVFFVDYYLWGSVTRGPITDELILEQLPQILNPLNE